MGRKRKGPIPDIKSEVPIKNGRGKHSRDFSTRWERVLSLEQVAEICRKKLEKPEPYPY